MSFSEKIRYWAGTPIIIHKGEIAIYAIGLLLLAAWIPISSGNLNRNVIALCNGEVHYDVFGQAVCQQSNDGQVKRRAFKPARPLA